MSNALAQELSSIEMQRAVVCQGFFDKDSAVMLTDLQTSDLSDHIAQAGHKAIMRILREGREVAPNVIKQELLSAEQPEAYTVLRDLWMSDCVMTLSHMKADIAQIREESTRARVQIALKQGLFHSQDSQVSLDHLHGRLVGLIAEAFSRSIKQEAVHEAVVLRELADEMASAKAAQLAGQTTSILNAISTGIAPLDDAIDGGGAPEEYIILAAAPSMGKSALGLKIARNWARFGEVYLWSGEMSRRALARRIAAQALQKPIRLVTDLDVREVEAKFCTRLHIDAEKGINAERLAQKIEMFRLSHPNLKGIVVDYLGLLADNDYKEVSRASRRMVAMAGKLQVPVLVLCQLSRDIAKRSDPRPQLADLRESGQIEQDAHKVLMLHRPSYFEDPNKTADADPADARVYVRKNRDGPRNKCIRLQWSGDTVSFSDPHRKPEFSPCDMELF